MLDEQANEPEASQGLPDAVRYWRDLDWLIAAVHELPAGILWGAHGASAGECEEMLDGLGGFQRLCDRLVLADHGTFIDGCRWHFEHYPHYLDRRRHFADYATYVQDRHGPLTVPSPPAPPFRRL